MTTARPPLEFCSLCDRWLGDLLARENYCAGCGCVICSSHAFDPIGSHPAEAHDAG